jgi:hypothetical protein
MRGSRARRFIWVLVLAAAAGLAFETLRQRRAAPAPAADEIDEASKAALREILEREEE